MRAVTLAFVDPELERGYLAQRWARYVSRQTALGFAITAIVWVLLILWLPTAIEDPDVGIVQAIWGVNVPVLLGAALAVRLARREALVQAMPVVSGALACIGLALVAAQALLPGRFDAYAGPALALYVLCVHAFMGLRFLAATLVSLGIVMASLLVSGLVVGERPADLATSAFFLLVAQVFGMFISRRDERYRRREHHQALLLAEERAKSERLLDNMLPTEIADRLKRGAGVIADAHDEVTVLFADIVGFTVLSGRVPPAELVELLDRVFTAFDGLADRYGLEKIKTIGDAYMVVGGLPTPRPDHARAVVEMALAMLDTLPTVRAELGLRIGIHTGPVVAGVIGKRKHSYDLWGDTVNTASRMESHGAPGRVHVSEAVRDALGDAFALEPRGPTEIKGKGTMTTFWVSRRPS